MQRPEQEEQRNKHITRIRTSVHNLTAILNDFLSLDKLESGMLAPNPENPLICNAMVEDLIDEMHDGLQAWAGDRAPVFR
jgi:two-component system sensor kinase FixL